MTKWGFLIDIPRRSSVCFKAQEPLNPGVEYYSVLTKGEEEKYSREDYCLACWEMVRQDKLSGQLHTHWKAKVATKKEPIFYDRESG